MTKDELIEFTNKTITELVYPKWNLQKAYNYYNGKMDSEQYRYIEEQYGIGNPTSVEFIPLIKKHIDALVGEYLGTPILPKVTCKDADTISKITREKELTINKEVFDFLQKRLNNKLILYFLQSKNLLGLSIVDTSILEAIDKLVENLNDNFISLYEIAALNVVEYIMQARDTDIMTKLRYLILDLLITGYTYYKVEPTVGNNNIKIEVLNPLNTFTDKNPESPYIKDSLRVVVRKWMTKLEVLAKYGKELSSKDKDLIDTSWEDSFSTSTYYIRSYENHGVPQTEGLLAGKEIVPGYPSGPYNTYNYLLIPVYEVEWIKTDSKYVMQRYKSVRIGESIYILYGKDDNVVRSHDNPNYCTLTVNGVYFLNRGGEPYSLVLSCAALLDKYNLLHFFRDNLIANSGTVGDFVDISVLPKFLGSDLPERLKKWISYKKSGMALIDSSQDGRLGAGLTPINTIYNGYDDTIKALAIQSILLAIDSIELTTSSITGVFRERLNGILQKDAVTNVLTSVNNSFIITKLYYQLMDTIVSEILLDSLNEAKIVFKNGLKGTILLGDKQLKVFTALPEYFTISDYDIHITTSTDITRQLEQLKLIVPELVKAGAVTPDLIIEAMTTKSLTDFKIKVKKAVEKQKEELNQLGLLQLQSKQLQLQLLLAQLQLLESLKKIESLNEAKLQLETEKNKANIEIEWFKARTDKNYKDAQALLDAKRTEIELLLLRDGNPYNDKVVQMK